MTNKKGDITVEQALTSRLPITITAEGPYKGLKGHITQVLRGYHCAYPPGPNDWYNKGIVAEIEIEFQREKLKITQPFGMHDFDITMPDFPIKTFGDIWGEDLADQCYDSDAAYRKVHRRIHGNPDADHPNDRYWSYYEFSFLKRDAVDPFVKLYLEAAQRKQRKENLRQFRRDLWMAYGMADPKDSDLVEKMLDKAFKKLDSHTEAGFIAVLDEWHTLVWLFDMYDESARVRQWTDNPNPHEEDD